MATANSGRFAAGRGVIRVGAPADVVQFRWHPGDETLAVEAVLVAGSSALQPGQRDAVDDLAAQDQEDQQHRQR